MARAGVLRWEHRGKGLLALLRLRPRRLRLRARAGVDTSCIRHPWLLLASDKGVEGGVGMDDLRLKGAVLAQARGLRGRTRHIILEGSCRDRVRGRGEGCLDEAVDAGAAGSVADFPTGQACRAGEKVNRPYHGEGLSSKKLVECCTSKRLEISPGGRRGLESSLAGMVGAADEVGRQVLDCTCQKTWG